MSDQDMTVSHVVCRAKEALSDYESAKEIAKTNLFLNVNSAPDLSYIGVHLPKAQMEFLSKHDEYLLVGYISKFSEDIADKEFDKFIDEWVEKHKEETSFMRNWIGEG